MAKVPDLEPFVSAAIASSGRTRNIIVVSLSWSLLLVAVLLNTAPGSWQNARFAKVLEVSKESRAQIRHNEPAFNQLKQKLSLETDAQLATRVSNWEKQRLESSTVQVPIVGLKIDVNDAGLVSAIGLVVIYSWFLASLKREYSNFTIVFAEARKTTADNMRSTYLHLSMHEVLHQPKLPFDNEKQELSPFRKTMRWLAENLRITTITSWVPFLVLSTYLGFDIGTFWVAELYGQEVRTVAMYVVESIACLFLGLGALVAVELFGKIREVWNEAYSDAKF